MPADPPRARTLHALAWIAILAVAATLRAWKLGWGLADGIVFPDESRWLAGAAAFVPLRLQSFAVTSLVYPTLYGYVSGLATCGLAAAGIVAPTVGSHVNPGLLLVVRATSVAAGVATVALVAAIGGRLGGPAVGLAAAAFMAVVPLEALQTHYASVDVLLTTTAALVLLACVRLRDCPTPTSAALAGAAVGLAFATKYTGLAFGSAVAWAIGEHARAERRATPLLTLGAAAAGAALLAAFVACPPCALRPDLLVKGFRFDQTYMAAGVFPNRHLAPSLGWVGVPYVYQALVSLPWTLGWPLWLATVAGVVAAVRRHDRADRLLLAAIVPYAIVMCGITVTFQRYLLPMVPALVVLAARALVDGRHAILRAALVLVVVSYGAALGASQVDHFSWDQQREVGVWLGSHLPRHSTVVVPQFLDYFRLSRFVGRAGMKFDERVPVNWRKGDPAAIVVPKWFAIALARDHPEGPGVRELAALESGTGGYHEAARWPIPPYLQMGLYTALDPALAVDLWQGAIGFRIYVRDGVGAGGQP